MTDFDRVITALLVPLFFFSLSMCFPVSSLAESQGDIYEPDDSFDERLILDYVPDETIIEEHTFHKFFDEDWVQFKAIKGHTYSITAGAKDSNFNCDPVIELYASDGVSLLKRENNSGPGGNESLTWTSPDDSSFFIRFVNEGIYYGSSVVYTLTFYASLFDPLPGYLTGFVTSKGAGINGVVLAASTGAGVSQSGGRYILGLQLGVSFTISVHKDGYLPQSFSITIPEENPTLNRNIELIPIPDPNQPPVITGSPEKYVPVNGLYSFKPIATDPENDSMVFSIANKPSWLSFNPETGMILGVANANHVGTHGPISITVQDSRGASSHLSPFMIEVKKVSVPGFIMLLLKS